MSDSQALGNLAPMDVAGRAERVRAAMADAECDALLVANLVNVRYLTGFTGSAGLAWLGPDELVLVTDRRYTEQSVAETGRAGVEVRIEPDGAAAIMVTMRSARMASAKKRWSVTIGGGSSVMTATPPSPACVNITTSVMAAGTSARRVRSSPVRAARKATTNIAATSSPTMAAVSRWEYSIRTWYSNGGMMLPWQSGQSGQARPDPVTRTKLPRLIRKTVVIAAASASPSKALR